MEKTLSINSYAVKSDAINSSRAHDSSPINPDARPADHQASLLPTRSSRLASTMHDPRTPSHNHPLDVDGLINFLPNQANYVNNVNGVCGEKAVLKSATEEDVQLAQLELSLAGPSLGIEVRGLDLSKPLSSAVVKKIDELITI